MKNETNQAGRKTIYCRPFPYEPDAFIGIREWANLEGVDIEVVGPNRPEQRFSLLNREWDALCAVMADMRTSEMP